MLAVPNPAPLSVPVGETLGDREEEEEIVECADWEGDREER